MDSSQRLFIIKSRALPAVYLFSQLTCRRISFLLAPLDFSFYVNAVHFEQRRNLYLEFLITQMNNLKCINFPGETLISASLTRLNISFTSTLDKLQSFYSAQNKLAWF